MSRQVPWSESDTIIVIPWPDPKIDEEGHDPRSLYVERFWLPIVGPSAVWLLRHMAVGFDALSPDTPLGEQVQGEAPRSGSPLRGFPLHLDVAAVALGVGLRTGKQRPIIKAIGRLVHFNVARIAGLNHLEVRRRLPPVARRHLDRLPADLRAAHERWADDEAAPVQLDRQRRSRELALSLIELGEDPGAVERQLMSWRFGPSLSEAAVGWAITVQRYRLAAADSDHAPDTVSVVADQGVENVLASSINVRTP